MCFKVVGIWVDVENSKVLDMSTHFYAYGRLKKMWNLKSISEARKVSFIWQVSCSAFTSIPRHSTNRFRFPIHFNQYLKLKIIKRENGKYSFYCFNSHGIFFLKRFYIQRWDLKYHFDFRFTIQQYFPIKKKFQEEKKVFVPFPLLLNHAIVTYFLTIKWLDLVVRLQYTKYSTIEIFHMFVMSAVVVQHSRRLTIWMKCLLCKTVRGYRHHEMTHWPRLAVEC